MQGMLGKARKTKGSVRSTVSRARASHKNKNGQTRRGRPNKSTKGQLLTPLDQALFNEAAITRAKLRGKKNATPAADVAPIKPKRQSLVGKWLNGLLSSHNKDMPFSRIQDAAKRAKFNMEQVEIAANELRVTRYWPFSTYTAGPQWWKVD
jgi:hypothetical protein